MGKSDWKFNLFSGVKFEFIGCDFSVYFFNIVNFLLLGRSPKNTEKGNKSFIIILFRE